MVFGDDFGAAGGLSDDLAVGFGVGFEAAEAVLVDEATVTLGPAEETAAEANFFEGGADFAAEPFSAGRLAGRLSLFPALLALVTVGVPAVLDTAGGTATGAGAAVELCAETGGCCSEEAGGKRFSCAGGTGLEDIALLPNGFSGAIGRVGAPVRTGVGTTGVGATTEDGTDTESGTGTGTGAET